MHFDELNPISIFKINQKIIVEGSGILFRSFHVVVHALQFPFIPFYFRFIYIIALLLKAYSGQFHYFI